MRSKPQCKECDMLKLMERPYPQSSKDLHFGCVGSKFEACRNLKYLTMQGVPDNTQDAKNYWSQMDLLSKIIYSR